ncbi:D-tyrosyl-tRNA(Tyr) deacylase [Candidatus Woesearchaeota archaeon]|nr:D-tyrosyl-tRNA(Tyr) deacylase [Candidatus Woesearchaeota archaeon]|tara:strand:- start:52 stop:867 length:816 start_codon:yes stop_codon:yes gene_type:complete
MKFAIIVSEKDPAGLNIKDSLVNLFGFKELDEKFDDSNVYQLNNIQLYIAKKESIHYENIDKEIVADLFVFATKHQSAKGVSSLSCHAPGNWSKAEAGGKDKELCVAPALFLKEAFVRLNQNAKDTEHEITMECTHHGPFLNKPCFFIEIGSSLEEWENKDSGNIIAKTIMDVLSKDIKEGKSCFVIGGSHYNQAANKIMLRTEYAVGHVCPKYMLEFLDENLLKHAVERTVPKVEIVLLDWKGLGHYKQKVVELLEKVGIKCERVQRVLK